VNYFTELFPKIIRYRLSGFGLFGPGRPINLTFSVTNACQSRCKTCLIWKLYKKNPQRYRDELDLNEIDKIFQSMGHIYIFNISGGEPFLRKDLPELIKLACRYLSPGIIHIPTNAIASSRIEKSIQEILQFLKTDYPKTHLTIKPSLDHFGEKHDEIRGVPGNFEKVMRLFHRLKELQPDHTNRHVELGTVISRWNVDDIEEIAENITRLGVDSYRNEIAEQRSEMFNMKNPITPASEDYEKAIRFFVAQTKKNMKKKVLFQRITQAFRLVYYELAIQILKFNKQIIPCYAGISNAHMTPYGDIWPCCTLGYEKPMGNLREFNYDFKALWYGPRAREIRKYIKNRNCACPLANQAYSNILLHFPSLGRVVMNLLKR